VSTHGRLLIWALPGLVPLASVGPLPPLSAADGCGFCVDGMGLHSSTSQLNLSRY
jgi:hypothetical protein